MGGWEAAFKSFIGHKTKHYQACSKEMNEGIYAPGLCQKEIEQIFPELSNLVLQLVDENKNKMISNGEFKTFFTVVTVFSHMAAPVVQQGNTFTNMMEYPIDDIKAWLGWDQGEPTQPTE